MSRRTDDPFGDDFPPEELAAEIDAHGEAIYQFISDYAQAQQLNDHFVSDLVFEAALRLRMVGYVMETEKPSGTGLKLELDRCRRDLDGMFREHKKMADRFVRMSSNAIEEFDASENADEPRDPSKPK